MVAILHVLSKGILIICTSIRGIGAAGDEGGFGLGGLGLLATLLRSLLFLHLLIAETSQSAGDLLHLFARHLLCQVLRKFFEEEAVVSLLGVAIDDGRKSGTQDFKLLLGLRVEKGQRSQVHGLGRILFVDNDGSTNSGSLASIADTNSAEKVLSVGKISFLFGTSESFSTICFGLVVVTLFVIRCKLSSPAGLMLGNALGLGFLAGSSFRS